MRSARNSINHLILIGILLFTNSITVVAEDFLLEEDLRLSWVFYDDGQKVMLPFLDNGNENPISIHLHIDQDYGNEARLMLDMPKNASLFIEDMFIKHFEVQKKMYYSIDSIKNGLGTKSFQLTLYSKQRFEYPPEAKIGFIHKTFDSTIDVNPISLREIDQRSDFLKLVILLIFTFFVVLYTLFRSDLIDFLSLQSLITFRFTETTLFKYRSLTKTQTLVIVYIAALLAGLLIMFLHYYNNPFEETFLMSINPLFGWFILFLLVLISIFFKFILISIISFLFKVSEKINFYLIEFLRMAMIFYSIVFLIMSYTIINHFYSIDSIIESMIVIIIVFNLARFIILYFKFRRTVTMKSLHLFSYLCTTELIPIIIGLNFFLK